MTAVSTGAASINLQGRAIQVVDLTHRLSERFNFSAPVKRIALEPIPGSGAAVGMRLNRLSVVEHTGTHIDAPSHFDADGATVGDIPIGDLIVPLVVIDLRARVFGDRNAPVLPSDIEEWESVHGPLPDNCCVAMLSGWDVFDQFENGTRGIPKMLHSPGFSPEAAQMLIERGNVRGIAVEALTIDIGCNGPHYPVHQLWLKNGRWGLEGLVNLDRVPPNGAWLVVGAAPVVGATGMPVRAVAMF